MQVLVQVQVHSQCYSTYFPVKSLVFQGEVPDIQANLSLLSGLIIVVQNNTIVALPLK